MRVALFHNRYLQRGGEDHIVDFDAELLRKAGHEVHRFTLDNRLEIGSKRLGALRAGLRARWNRETLRAVSAFLEKHPVDVGHVHNFFPVLSPAVHAALRGHGVASVQSLHNYRLLCANGAFLRENRPCEDCVARGPWNAVRHGCYRNSRLQTAAWAEMTAYNRRRGTWRELVDLFIASSVFARDKLLAAGLPPDRLHVRPNAVPDPGDPGPPGEGAVFVGRLSPEKGVRVLLEAWRELGGYPLKILGTGPEEPELRRIGAGIEGVRFLGECSHDEVYAALRDAAFAVVPSIWYEIYPVAVAEALAWGRPVVVSHPTSLSEIVEHGHNGLPFESGNPADLARACRTLISDRELLGEMGRAARFYFEDHLSPEVSSENLVGLYADAIRVHAERNARPS